MGRASDLGYRTAALPGLVRCHARSAICTGVVSTALTFLAGTIAAASPYEADAQVEEPPVPTEPSPEEDVFAFDVVNAAMPTGTAGGRTPGSLQVTSSGAAAYEIPLWTPPGVGAVDLKLSLAYNSRAGNGVLGQGWSLAGLSAIAQCNKTFAQDGEQIRNGRWCLGGQQLKVVGSSANGPIYATERESFSRVETIPYNGLWSAFRVTTKNELVYEYGTTTDSRAVTPNGLVFALSRVYDRQSPVPNQISITYANDGNWWFGTPGSYRPLQITYPRTASGQGPFYQIDFSYSARPITDVSIGGAHEPNKLDAITISPYGSGAAIKSYNFGYTASAQTGRLRLSTVTECGASSCLRPTTVGYFLGSAASNATLNSGQNASNAKSVMAVDINGDGRDDLIYPKTSGSSASRWWAMLSSSTSSTGFGSPIDTGLTTLNARVYEHVGQFDRTGRNQLFVAQNGYWFIASFTGSSFTTVNTGIPYNGEFAVADWDGDGLSDIVAFGFTTVTVRRNTTTAVGSPTFSATPVVVYTTPSGEFLSLPGGSPGQLDFNGDGRADTWIGTCNDFVLCIPTVLGVVSNGFSQPATTFALDSTYGNWGDFNGDGCSDLISGAKAYVSDCAGAFATIGTEALPYGSAGLLGDFNGDGRTDSLYSKSGDWYVRTSRGDSFGPETKLSSPSAPNNTAWFAMDWDGDGILDMGWRDDSNSGRLKLAPHNTAAAVTDLAATFTDGFGITQSVSYASITNPAYYTKGSAAVFPEVDIQAPLKVVTQVTANGNSGVSYTQQYLYAGAQANRQGRGLLGFTSVRMLDSRNALYTLTYFGLGFPYTGLPTRRVVYKTSLATKVSDVATVFDRQDLGTGYEQRVFAYPKTVTELQYEYPSAALVTERVTTNTYGDGRGNLTASSTTVTDRDAASPFNATNWQSSFTASYYNSDATNCFGLPNTLTETRTAPGKTAMTSARSYLADTAACRITQQTAEPTVPSLATTTMFGFDSCGNPSTIDVVASNWNGATLPVRRTTINYGDRCQLPETITNPAGEVTRLAYHYDFGVLSALTDENQLVTSWVVDDFGRRTRETRPDGTATTWSYDSCNTPSCMSGGSFTRFHVQEVSFGTVNDEYDRQDLYFNGTERLAQRTYLRALGISTTERFVHDGFGRVTIQYNPAAAGADNGALQWTYDPLGRVTAEKLTYSNGIVDRTTSIGYAGRTTTTTDPLNRVRSIIRDPLGNVRQVIDPAPGGTTHMDYDSFGSRISIVDPIGATSTGVADVSGRLSDWTDADRGRWTFRFNSLGELVGWADAKNQSFSAVYDSVGRMVSRTEPEGMSTFTFGSSAANHDVGKLTAMSGYGYTESLSYDAYARPATRVITTDQAYQYDYIYNSIGAVDTIYHPLSPIPSGQSGQRFAVQYSYSYGTPVAITDVTNPTPRTLWSVTAANDFGSPLTESLGGGVATVSSGYKPYTNELASSQAGKTPSTSDRQNLTFQWDKAGNLIQRADVNQALTEIFTVDALNRVTGSTRNGTSNLTVNYDASGNITSKSDVGAYSYASTAHPHAVTAAGAKTFSHDANGNQVSRDGQTQTWASFNLPTVLRQPIGGTTYQTQLYYGPDHQRWKQVAGYSNGTETTFYVGGLLEKQSSTATGQTYWRHYVETPSGFAVVARSSDGSTSTHYAVTDHLGSTDTIIGGAGNTAGKFSYTAFGARRGSDWTSTTNPDWVGIANSTRHGFTGHEHLDNVNLIHMNGRVYDPGIGRVLSVDPIIGDVTDSQTINPYAYVGNRPHVWTDPTGYCAPDGCITITFSISLSLSKFFGFGDKQTPPPESSMPGASAQSGLPMCSAGVMSSSQCGGYVISVVGTNPGCSASTGGPDCGVGSFIASVPGSDDYIVDEPIQPIRICIPPLVCNLDDFSAAVSKGDAPAAVAAILGTRYFRAAGRIIRGVTGPVRGADGVAAARAGGRLGGTAHRRTVSNRAGELERQGHTVTAGGGRLPERSVVTHEGRRRFPDISTRDPSGNPYHENVGRSTVGGDPIARERRALDDIRRATGTEPGYTPYDR